MKKSRFLTLMIVMIIGLFSIAYAETATIISEAEINVADAESLEAIETANPTTTAVITPPVIPQAVPQPQALPQRGELISWWDGGNQAVPMGQVITLVDVWTGKSFKAIRTYGHNHADMEAATLADAQIMKSIWGGSWSWERRPTVAVINGRAIAASCAGMPHAGLDSVAAEVTVSNRSGGFGRGMNLDKVKGNGMDGHFDLHLLNSKTHGSNRVDAKHQAMIQQAAGK